ncbi:unnamed protein product [Polarella glacialis]|uniref:Uncharacterized protein n=1 Tax=Polarella glacialis TaxID=89957 RepID=A0A813H674_POLGL|nr:unnamed protein product [Polarella glacialis]
MNSMQLHGQRSAARGPADSWALCVNRPDRLADKTPHRPAARPRSSSESGRPDGQTTFADSGALTRADAERPELASWEQQLTVPSASTYDAHDMPALSSSRIWHATRKHGFYYGFAITLDLLLLLRTLGKQRRG